MRSIRQRLFLQIGLVLLITYGLIWLGNAFFLEGYYIGEQKKVLLENYVTLNALDTSDLSDAYETYLEIESNSNVEIVILDLEDELIYASGNYYSSDAFNQRIASGNIDSNAVPLRPSKLARADGTTRPQVAQRSSARFPNQEMINEDLFFSTGVDPIHSGDTLALIGTLDNGYYINARIPLTSITASIAVVNDFLVITSLTTLLIAMLITFVFSNRFTRPIKEISRVTGHMKHLDFQETCMVTSKDELGALASNVNDMSQVLSTTLATLKVTNNNLKDEIEAKNVLDSKRRQLLNNVSHELKTPLALMEGYAEALKLGIHTDQNKTDFYCDVIMDETQKMNALVQNLLNIDQLAFGDVATHPTVLNLSDYLQATIAKFQPQVDKKDIRLSLNIESDLFILADPLRLEQVFVNYLTNAINYCNKDKTIRVSTKSSSDQVIVEVFNSAKKLSPDEMNKIWDSFYKIDQSRSRDQGGHGLGLSIVQAIQSSDQLDFGVYNEGNGVVFWFQQSRHLK